MTWNNIAGYTSLPGNTFTLDQASKSPEDLAMEALFNFKGNRPYDSNNADGTSLFPQGSTIVTEQHYDYDRIYYYDPDALPTSNCPPDNESFCNEFGGDCINPKLGYPSNSSPSVNDNAGLLLSLSFVYLVLTGYIATVLPMGNGARLKPWFPFSPRFWIGCRKSNSGRYDAEEGANVAEDDNVGIVSKEVHKHYGKVEALKPFSITMKPGTVTSLLGHNGAVSTQPFTLSFDQRFDSQNVSGQVNVCKYALLCSEPHGYVTICSSAAN